MVRYKVVETSTVTEDSLESILNEWSSKGWRFESIQFVRTDASRRPGMAFLVFTSEQPDVPEPLAVERRPDPVISDGEDG